MSERRWKFMSKIVIGKQDNPMLVRWRIIQTPLGGIYVHRIHREDLDRDPHDHPWVFRTWIIRGSYEEDYYPDTRFMPAGVRYGNGGRTQKRERWSYRRFPLEAAHRITKVNGKLTTLVLVGPKVRLWGFYVLSGLRNQQGCWIDYREYSQVTSKPVYSDNFEKEATT